MLMYCLFCIRKLYVVPFSAHDFQYGQLVAFHISYSLDLFPTNLLDISNVFHIEYFTLFWHPLGKLLELMNSEHCNKFGHSINHIVLFGMKLNSVGSFCIWDGCIINVSLHTGQFVCYSHIQWIGSITLVGE